MNRTTAITLTLQLTIAIIFSSFPGISAVAQENTNRQIAASYITEVVNNRKLELIKEIYAPEYVFHGMDGKDLNTIKDNLLISFLQYLFTAFPDLHYNIENSVVENDMVALNLTLVGTHKAEFMGLPASGKQIKCKEMFFFRFQNKKIIEGWGVVDINGIKEQIAKK